MQEEDAALEAKERVKAKKARRKDRKAAAAAETAAVVVAAAPAESGGQQEGGQLTESTPTAVATAARGDSQKCVEPSNAAPHQPGQATEAAIQRDSDAADSVNPGTWGGSRRAGNGADVDHPEAAGMGTSEVVASGSCSTAAVPGSHEDAEISARSALMEPAMRGLGSGKRLGSQGVSGITPGGQIEGGQGEMLRGQCQDQHRTEQQEDQGEDAELERLLAGLMVSPEQSPLQLGPALVAAPSIRDDSRGFMTLLAVLSGPSTEAAPRQHPISAQRTRVGGVEPLLCSLTKVQLIDRKLAFCPN